MEFKRRFWVLNDNDEHEPDRTAALIDYGLAEGETWSEVLRHPRTVILAEAGAGKTYELQQRARKLTADGSFAVFVPLEALASSSLTDLLDVEEEQRLAAWLKDGAAAGFFFLDAVDELKLTDRKLDRALLQLGKAIHGHQHRARIFLSSRPSDWRKVSDREVLEQRLGYSAPESLRPESSAEAVFLRALRRQEGAGEEKDENDHLPAEPVRMLVMLPMSVHQIRQFAAHSGVHDVEAFLSELERRNAWTFARRPLDLEDLVQLWLEEGRLGRRAEQHEANVRTKLRDNPERADANVLSTSKAREGAERLALALFLTKSRTLRAPGQDLPLGRAAGNLDPADVLPDWTAGERSALLRRALFDPATHGRVRFHHRSVQEYLAAQRLRHLRDAGMSIKALRRLLFATRYGIDVVIPSMRAVVAWLALWIDDVRRETMRREPEILVSFGDPETLPIETRSELLARLAETYGSGRWRGLELPLDEVRRLAHPELGPTIRELWGSGPENQEIRGLLLRLIWQGRIESCADIAETLASDGKQSDMDRILAIRALVSTGREDCLLALTDDMTKHPDAWSDRVIISTATELFPGILSIDNLVHIIQQTQEPDNSVEGFGWAVREMADQLVPTSELAIGLRDRLAELVLSQRAADLEPYDIRGSYNYLTPALAKLCLAQLSRLEGEPDASLIHAAAIAARFGQRELGWQEPVGDLRAFFQSDGQGHRAKAFWTELDLMDLLSPTTDSWERLYNAENNGLIGPIVNADTVWLERALMDARHPERRAPALHALVNLWRQRDQSPEVLETLASAVGEDAALLDILDARTRPKPLSPEQERRRQEAIRKKEEVAAQRQDRLKGWQDWREELLADPDAAFSSDRLQSDVSNVYVWLKAGGQRNRWSVWDGEKLAAAFGPVLKDRMQEAFQKHWRSVTPVPWSGRPRDERNVTLGSWIIGLCGISAESESPGWAAHLTPDEARLAVLYSLIELNGFASFLPDLAEAHPDAVEDVIGEELSVELQQGIKEAHLPTLQNLGHADLTVKRLMAPRLLSELGKRPAAVLADEEFQVAQHLDRVLHLLAEITEGAERERVALVCRERLLGSPRGGALQLAWLKGLIEVDAVAAANELVAILGRADDPETRSRGAAILGHLFGELHGIAIEIADPGLRAQVLGKLIRAAYSFVRREEDVVREGNYTPDSRDDAQSARGSLLAQLVETPGDEARRVLLELAEEPDFQHFRDRLRFLARQRAATDAEGPPYAAEAVYDLERRFEAPPSDRDGLFVVVLDRLDDIAHDIRDGDFTDRKTLRTISDETEMQRTLAGRLEAKANGAYMVVREEEVADHKLPDIRLAATRGDQRVAVEVKIADNDWSIADFEHSLEHQVVGQYLRHDRCKAGCFLLTFAGTKWWNNPAGGRRLTFIQLIEHLNKKARVLEDAENGRIRLSVVGLDLTDPELAPAHR